MGHRTVRMYWGMQFLRAMIIHMTGPIYMLYLRDAGLSYQEAYAVNAVCMVTILVLEIPTGVIADLFGRRLSWILSHVFWGMGMLTYAASSAVPGFLCGEILAAIGMSLASGSFSAWIADEVRFHNDSDIKLNHVLEHGGLRMALGSMVGAMIGGWVCTHGMRWGWIAGGVSSLLLAVWCAIRMPEHGWRRATTLSRAFIESAAIRRRAMRITASSRALWGIAILNGMFALGTQALNMGWQPFFAPTFNIRALSVIASGMFAFLALGSWIVTRWNGRISTPTGFGIAFGQIALCALLAGHLSPTFAVLPYLLHEVGRGAWTSAQEVWANLHIQDNSVRATVLSINSMGFRVFAAPGLLIAGGIADAHGISASWVFSACVLVVAALSSLRLLKNT